MNHVKVPLPLFYQLEPQLKEYYDIDRQSIIDDISNSVDYSNMINDPKRTEFLDEYGKLNVSKYALATLEEFFMPVSENYDFESFNGFCKNYEINNDSEQYYLLWFMYALRMRRECNLQSLSDDATYDYWQYVLDVRPEMLKLYIALYSPKKQESCKISFGTNRPIEVDTRIPWLQLELKRYLNKYLGVSSVKEAERELYLVYGKKTGVRLDKDAARYIWGTYYLLQTIPAMQSKRNGSVTNEQSRFITDYLITLEMIDPVEAESNTIRGRLNYFLKNFDSLSELLDEAEYKLSPNNDPNKNLYGYF